MNHDTVSILARTIARLEDENQNRFRTASNLLEQLACSREESRQHDDLKRHCRTVTDTLEHAVQTNRDNLEKILRLEAQIANCHTELGRQVTMSTKREAELTAELKNADAVCVDNSKALLIEMDKRLLERGRENDRLRVKLKAQEEEIAGLHRERQETAARLGQKDLLIRFYRSRGENRDVEKGCDTVGGPGYPNACAEPSPCWCDRCGTPMKRVVAKLVVYQDTRPGEKQLHHTEWRGDLCQKCIEAAVDWLSTRTADYHQNHGTISCKLPPRYVAEAADAIPVDDRRLEPRMIAAGTVVTFQGIPARLEYPVAATSSPRNWKLIGR